MPSTCPKCHSVLEEDEICCALVSYTWRCTNCFKLSTGFVVPYGRCFLCGGELEIIRDRDFGDGMRFRAVRDAMMFELSSVHFFSQAREGATTAEQCIVLEHLFEEGLDHIHDLEEKYHAQLDRETVEAASDPESLLYDWPFRGIGVKENSGIAELYRVALETERRERDHLVRLARQFAAGLEHELCRELAAEEDEHIAMLETELAQFA